MTTLMIRSEPLIHRRILRDRNIPFYIAFWELGVKETTTQFKFLNFRDVKLVKNVERKTIMKRDYLKELGLNDEQIEAVMNENGKDINSAKSNNTTELENLRKENETLKAQNKELDNSFKASQEKYKDYDELSKFKADYEAKELNSKRYEFLKSKGCKHPELIAKEIDWGKDGIAYNDEKKTFEGLDDTIKTLKDSYGDLFENVANEHIDPKGNSSLAKGPEGDFLAKYKAEHPNLQW